MLWILITALALAGSVEERACTKSKRHEGLVAWQRSLYRDRALREATGGVIDLELRDRFQAMTSDALFGRAGSVLHRRNSELLAQYARRLEKAGLEWPAKFGRQVIRAIEAKLKPAEIRQLGLRRVEFVPVRRWPSFASGPELLRSCGNDLLEAGVALHHDRVVLCPGALLRTGVSAWGVEVRAPVADSPSEGEPLAVKYSEDQLWGWALEALRAWGERASEGRKDREEWRALLRRALAAASGSSETWKIMNYEPMCGTSAATRVFNAPAE